MTIQVIAITVGRGVAVSGEISDIVNELVNGVNGVKAYPVLSAGGVASAALHPAVQPGSLAIKGYEQPAGLVYITGGPIRRDFDESSVSYGVLEMPPGCRRTSALSLGIGRDPSDKSRFVVHIKGNSDQFDPYNELEQESILLTWFMKSYAELSGGLSLRDTHRLFFDDGYFSHSNDPGLFSYGDNGMVLRNVQRGNAELRDFAQAGFDLIVRMTKPLVLGQYMR